MNTIKEVAFLTLLLSFTFFLPGFTNAQSIDELEEQGETVVLLHKSNHEMIEVYEDESLTQMLKMIPNDTAAVLLEHNDDWGRVAIQTDEDNSTTIGYVSSRYIIPYSEAESYRLERMETVADKVNIDFSIEENNEEALSETSNKTEEDRDTKQSKPVESKQEDNLLIPTQSATKHSTQTQQQLRGVALKQPTHVYAEMSTNSNVLKSYNQGHILLFRPHHPNWYAATVIINGKRHSGYIHANDVDLITQNQERLNGFAIRYVEVFASPTRNANVLKGYRQGHGLIYRTFSSEWYEATVYINGVRHTGYIHKSDLANDPPQQYTNRLKGIAKLSRTSVYSDKSKHSPLLKTYNQGHILIYRPHDDNWYQATVYLKGQPRTGYIHVNDVETATTYTQHLRGVANVSSTRVYASATRSARTLKSYEQGRILKYRSFTPNWYEATVYLNGQPHTGYIHVNDVETAVSTSSTLRGIGVASPTHVYERASINSRSLKNYKQGHILKYRTLSLNWYEATVYINGKAHTGYIHKNHVENIVSKQERITGFAMKRPTRAYSQASRTAPVLKSYSYGSKIIYRTFTDNWYEATVYVNGKANTAYFHKNDVSDRNGRIIVLDAGHGGTDPGAIGNGLQEKTLTLDIAQRTKQMLEERGFTVIMTRTGDEYVSLSDRTTIANRANADIFVSIHINAGGGTGIETWWYSKGPEPQQSNKLAMSIQNELIRETSARDRGIKDGNFHVNRESNMASALVELGFIDNANDAAKLRQSSYRQQLAKGIVNGIIRYFS